MKKLLLLCAALLISNASFASHMVRGYVRRDGTYVASHESMDPGEAKSTGFSYHDNELMTNNNSSSNDSGELTSNTHSNSSLNQY
jgi:hypothetical protein